MVNLVILLLDESGSMDTNATGTVISINNYINAIRSTNPEQLFTLVTFSENGRSCIKHIYTEIPISDVPDILPQTRRNYTSLDYNIKNELGLYPSYTYNPIGGTPLCEAILTTLEPITPTHLLERNITSVLVVIMTDGEENSSKREYTIEKTREFISASTFTYVYLGADQDAITNAQQYGISCDLSMSTNSQTPELSIPALCRITTAVSNRNNHDKSRLCFTNTERHNTIPRSSDINEPPSLRRQLTQVYDRH